MSSYETIPFSTIISNPEDTNQIPPFPPLSPYYYKQQSYFSPNSPVSSYYNPIFSEEDMISSSASPFSYNDMLSSASPSSSSPISTFSPNLSDDYFSYGIEWDTSSLFLKNDYEFVDRVVIEQGDMYKITAERHLHLDDYIPNPLDTEDEEKCNQKANKCDYCGYTVEVQFGVFYGFDLTNLQQTFIAFNQRWNQILFNKKIGNHEIMKENVYLASKTIPDCTIFNQRGFSDCKKTIKEANLKKK